ncbi:MAG: AAA family ATPase [Faecalibacterium sp.]|nr:AAA family ATPase [Ruminococcus sp.]MCM1393115.1 AAA family ATPase [Ruminococcus sp.]MCM1486506.1 AAA family ATPase [Faecalibacterium sp.]
MAEKIVIASGKGGVGKTSLTIGMAKALADSGEKVLIIDCDTLRSVDIVVGAGENILYDFGDIMLGRCKINDAIYKAGDISLITCPRNFRGVTIKKMRILLALLDPKFDYILLDSPAGTDLGFVLACIAADRGLVVSTPDAVCVRSVCTAADEMRKYGISDVRLVINRVIKKDILRSRFLNLDTVIDRTEVQLIGIVPEDKAIRFSSMGGGSIYQKGRPSYKAFRNIAGRIKGESIPLKF